MSNDKKIKSLLPLDMLAEASREAVETSYKELRSLAIKLAILLDAEKELNKWQKRRRICNADMLAVLPDLIGKGICLQDMWWDREGNDHYLISPGSQEKWEDAIILLTYDIISAVTGPFDVDSQMDWVDGMCKKREIAKLKKEGVLYK